MISSSAGDFMTFNPALTPYDACQSRDYKEAPRLNEIEGEVLLYKVR